MSENAILLVSCPDKKGILAKITGFIYQHGGNIVSADQHIDSEKGIFLARIEWQLDGFSLSKEQIFSHFRPIAETFSMKWKLSFSKDKKNVAIFVSKSGHCLNDLLYRFESKELDANLKLVISNHEDLRDSVERFGIKFFYFPKTPSNKLKVESREIRILKEHSIDLVVLARYMQILSPKFVQEFKNRIINIHHSFLPAFVGARPYHRAHERGVKIIGATSHYVTEKLDEGPIIEQDVVRVSHRDSVADLIRKGKDLEKVVLARAVRWHIEDKVLVYDNKTVIFE